MVTVTDRKARLADLLPEVTLTTGDNRKASDSLEIVLPTDTNTTPTLSYVNLPTWERQISIRDLPT